MLFKGLAPIPAVRGVEETAIASTLPRLRDLLAEGGRGSLGRRLDEVSRLAAARARELRAPLGARTSMTLTVVLVRRGERWLLHTTHWAIAAE